MATARLKRFDLSFRTAYAQAKEIALTQSKVTLLTPGSIQIETRGSSKFVYRYRYDAGGKRVAQYLGPEDADETNAGLRAAQEQIQAGAIFTSTAAICAASASTEPTTRLSSPSLSCSTPAFSRAALCSSARMPSARS